MIKINLLPPRILNQRRKRDFIIFVGICGAVAVFICYVLYLSLNQSIYPLEERLQRIENEINQYQPILKQIENLKEENNQIKARFHAFEQVVVKQSFWPRMLYQIYDSLPESTWLTEVKSDVKNNLVEIKGKSLDQTIGVSKFISNLKESELFTRIDFTKFSREKIMGEKVMRFEIKCFLIENLGD